MRCGNRGCARGLDGVDHAQVEDAIDGDGHVVVRDGALLRDAVRFLFQAVHVGDHVNDGHKELQPRLQHAAELAEAFDNPRLLLRDNIDPKIFGQVFF